MGKRPLPVIAAAAVLCAVYIVLELILPPFGGRMAVIAGAIFLCALVCARLLHLRYTQAEPHTPEPTPGTEMPEPTPETEIPEHAPETEMPGHAPDPSTQLDELERLKSDFVANASHELRTPVTSIKGFAQTLMDPGMDENTRLRFLHIIDAETDRLKRLIDDILTLGDIESGQAACDQTDLGACALDVYDMMKDTAVKKGLNISLYADPGLFVPSSRSHMEQLIINLVDNAIKYTEKGQISIRAVRVGDGVELSVSDTGIGIPEEDQPRIYERFYRVDRARSREKGGTGLGLAIVKHIALLYGAALSLESVPGQGSRFSVRFDPK